MIKYLSLYVLLLFAGEICGFGQSKLVFTGTYENSYHKLDSILIKDLNTGSIIVRIFPDTVLNLLITVKNEINADPDHILSQNYPNPFEDRTFFNVYLPEDEKLNINIFNIAGQSILNSERDLPPGVHTFCFTGTGEKIFILSVRTATRSASVKMLNKGNRMNSHAELEYIGNNMHQGNSDKGESEFDFNTGDNLVYTGFMTDGAGDVVSDTINDAPAKSTIYTFGFKRIKRIIILMYHKITDSIPIDEYERNITDFENDLAYLRSHNYQMLSMDDLLSLKTGGMTLTSDGIVITFDDGYESNYSSVYPLLTQNRMPATFFLVTEWIGTPDFMTWPEVWLMSQYADEDGKTPFVMGSHTSSHPYLEQSEQLFPTHQDYLNFLNTELGDSKNWIVDITGQSGIFLSLPYGDGANNQDIINTAVGVGYSGIRTSVWDSFTANKMNLFSLPSIPILSDTPINFIENYLKY